MEITKYLDLNNHRGITYQNVWGTVKVVLRYKFVASNISLKEN